MEDPILVKTSAEVTYRIMAWMGAVVGFISVSTFVYGLLRWYIAAGDAEKAMKGVKTMIKSTVFFVISIIISYIAFGLGK